MLNTEYKYLNPDDPALREMEDRLWRLGRNRDTQIYTDFVQGIVFQPLHISGGSTYQILSWAESINRVLIGEYLSHISKGSYKDFKFMASALIKNDDDNMPSEQFFDLARGLGAMGGNPLKTIFWAQEVQRAHDYYQNPPVVYFVS